MYNFHTMILFSVMSKGGSSGISHKLYMEIHAILQHAAPRSVPPEDLPDDDVIVIIHIYTYI
jgi:hypothetical protein